VKTSNDKQTKGFRDLRVWEESHRLALGVYRMTGHFPREHRYELVSQLNRAALSIPTNIAEGCGSSHTGEFIQFLNIALRSVHEVDYLLLFAKDAELINVQSYSNHEIAYRGVKRMLVALMKSMNSPS